MRVGNARCDSSSRVAATVKAATHAKESVAPEQRDPKESQAPVGDQVPYLVEGRAEDREWGGAPPLRAPRRWPTQRELSDEQTGPQKSSSIHARTMPPRRPRAGRRPSRAVANSRASGRTEAVIGGAAHAPIATRIPSCECYRLEVPREPHPMPDALTPDLLSVGTVLDGTLPPHAVAGQGAMGTVYEAHHTGAGKRVAVKVMHRELLAYPELAARFRREAKVTGELEHPHVVSVYGVGAHARGATVPGDGVPGRRGSADAPRARGASSRSTRSCRS